MDIPKITIREKLELLKNPGSYVNRLAQLAALEEKKIRDLLIKRSYSLIFVSILVYQFIGA